MPAAKRMERRDRRQLDFWTASSAGDEAILQPVTDDSFVPTALEAAWAREAEQRRGNGAAPQAASSAPVDHRQPHESQETFKSWHNFAAGK